MCLRKQTTELLVRQILEEGHPRAEVVKMLLCDEDILSSITCTHKMYLVLRSHIHQEPIRQSCLPRLISTLFVAFGGWSLLRSIAKLRRNGRHVNRGSVIQDSQEVRRRATRVTGLALSSFVCCSSWDREPLLDELQLRATFDSPSRLFERPYRTQSRSLAIENSTSSNPAEAELPALGSCFTHMF
jgi:hypothetical protein